MLAIDDLQWLDASSASALGFALRRLPESNITLLWTRRLGELEQSTAVEDALDADRIERHSRRAAQRRCDASGPPQPARRRRAAADAPAAARGVGREPVLRAGARAGARRRRRGAGPDAAAARPRTAGGARLRPSRRLRPRDARGSRARVRGRAPDAGTARRRGDRAWRTRPGARRERDRARPAARSGSRTRCWPRSSIRGFRPASGSASTVAWQRSPTIRSPVRVTSRSRPTGRMPSSLRCSRPQPRTTAAQGAPMVSAELGEHAMRLTPPEHRADLDRRAAAAARSHLAAGDVERGRALAAELARAGRAGGGAGRGARAPRRGESDNGRSRSRC